MVEHDEDTMREADYLIDVGPWVRVFWWEIVAAGNAQTGGIVTVSLSQASTCQANVPFQYQKNAVLVMVVLSR